MDKLGINLNFLIAQIINFGIVLFLLQRFLYKPVLNMLEERKEKVRQSLAEADRVRQEAAETQARHQQELDAARRENQQALQKAAQSGERLREEIIQQARREADEIKARAREEAEHEKERALSAARDEIANLVVLATEKLIGQSVDDKAQRRLVQDFLTQLEGAS